MWLTPWLPRRRVAHVKDMARARIMAGAGNQAKASCAEGREFTSRSSESVFFCVCRKQVHPWTLNCSFTYMNTWQMECRLKTRPAASFVADLCIGVTDRSIRHQRCLGPTPSKQSYQQFDVWKQHATSSHVVQKYVLFKRCLNKNAHTKKHTLSLVSKINSQIRSIKTSVWYPCLIIDSVLWWK